MKIFFCTLVFFVLVLVSGASEESVKAEPESLGISGFMMVHGGYLNLNDIKGFSSGVGGKMTFNLTPFLRIGTEGHSHSSIYDEAGSYFSLGWGGITLELMARWGIFQLAGGFTIGGGSVSHLQFISGTNSDILPDQVVFQYYGVFLFTPTLSFEFFLKDHMALIFKTDYLMGLPGKIADGMSVGPGFYVGIMFQK